MGPLLHRAAGGRSDLRLLDCGCGTGANLELLARHGRAYGFDLTAVGLEIGREAGRTRLAQASVAAIPFPSSAFDIVTSFDVLYSLPEPVEHAAVAEMYRVTRPGGFIVVNVAAMEALRGNHSILGRELRRYSRERLNRVLIAAGFAIVRLTYTNATLFPAIALVRAMQRRRGLPQEQDARAAGDFTVPPAAINAALAAILRIESWWVRAVDNPFGSSLLCLARKPG